MTSTQADRDRMTFDAYVDSGMNATRTAHDQGITRSTLKARVRRHSLRLTTDGRRTR